MAFVAAVLSVVVFLGLSIYFNMQGKQVLRWLSFAVALPLPWLLGMSLGRFAPKHPDDEEPED